MKGLLLTAAGFCLLGAIADNRVCAEIIQYHYTGSVYEVSGAPGGIIAAVGDPVSGSFMYDTDALPYHQSSTVAEYTFDIPDFFQLKINDDELIAQEDYFGVHNDTYPGDGLGILGNASSINGAVPTNNIQAWLALFGDYSVFSSTALPGPSLTLADLPSSDIRGPGAIQEDYDAPYIYYTVDTLWGEVVGPEPAPVQIGAPSILPRVAGTFITLPGNSPIESRASQGITWANGLWVASQGDDFHLEKLSSFSEDWSQLYVETSERNAVRHIGDIAFSGAHVYAPIQFFDEVVGTVVSERIARYDPITLELDQEWEVPGNTRIAGLEYYNGQLYGVEYLTGDNVAAAVVVLDSEQPDSESHRVYVDVPAANGIAIHDGKVYITSGTLSFKALGSLANDGYGAIHVFDLGSFLQSLDAGTVLDAETDGFGVYTYDTPDNLHAEGLAFHNDQLWVALGDEVARLDISRIASTRTKLANVSGDWGIDTFTELPDQGTSVSLASSSIAIGSSAECSNLYISDSSSVAVTGQGALLTPGTVRVRDGVLRIEGGSALVGDLVIGKAGSSGGEFSIADPNSTVEVSRRLVLEDGGSTTFATGSTIHMSGSDFENRSLSSASYSALANLSLVFEGGPTVVDLFEVAGQDLGSTAVVDNYLIDSLQLGGVDVARLLLVDAFDNQSQSPAAEALYLNELVVLPGSILYLNGLHLYVAGNLVSPGDGDSYGGGLILGAIPEPSGCVLLLAGSLLLLPVSRRSHVRPLHPGKM